MPFTLLQCWTKETAAKSNVWILFGWGEVGQYKASFHFGQTKNKKIAT